MPNRLTSMLTLLVSLLIFPLLSHAEVIKIGVFSDQNFRTTMKEWSKTATYLKQQLPQHVFQILPYSQQSNLVIDLEKNKLDFLITAKPELGQLMTDFALTPMLNVEKKGSQWILARSYNLPYTVTYSITNSLLKAPVARLSKTGSLRWSLSDSTEIQLSSLQQLKQLANQFSALVTDVLNQYWTVLIAALLSAILILLYRQWDRHHTRVREVKEHQQQSRDHSLSDTVF